MKKTFKKLTAAVMAATTLAVGTAGMTASAGSDSWPTPYGKLTGTSYTSTWSTTGTPVFRKVTARTSVENAAPYVYAKVVGYVNNALVFSPSPTTNTNSRNATCEGSSQSYVNSTVTGNGTHTVWSSSYSRVDHFTYF